MNPHADGDLGEEAADRINPLERVANLDRVLPAQADKDLNGGGPSTAIGDKSAEGGCAP